MIHLLYSALSDLVKKVMLRYIKTEVIAGKTGRELLKIDAREVNNMRTLTDVDIGEATIKALTSLFKDDKQQSSWKPEIFS